MTYATPQDVEEELGRAAVGAAEYSQFARWLRRAERTIKSRIPDLDDWVLSGQLDYVTVADVEAAAVARKALNPEGKANEKIDDYSYGRTDEAASVDIVITDAEWAQLAPSTPRGAFTVRPGWGA